MTASLDFGRKILMRRMLQALEKVGYRVEFAEEYHGWIVAGQGEDPAVMLLEADSIEKLRLVHPGNAAGFIDAVVAHVRSQISVQGSTSLGPPPSLAASKYVDVPSTPPIAVTGEVADDMILDEETVDDRPGQGDGASPGDRPRGGMDDAEELSVNMDELDASGVPAGDEKERLEKEVTEELSLVDFK